MKRFHYDDMKNITYVSWPAVSNDGRLSACVKYHADETTGLFPSEIFIIDNESGEERCLTENGHSEKQPRFNCDASGLYYLSDESGEWQVWYRDFSGSATPNQLTFLRHGINHYAVSEGVLAFEATLWPEEVQSGTWNIEMSTEEKLAWEEELDWRPYVAEDLIYKLDEWYGMRKGEYSHIGYIVSGNSALVETAGVEALFPSISPDNSKLAFMAYPYGGAKGRLAEMFVFDIISKQLVQITDSIGIYGDHAPVWTEDSNMVIGAGFPLFDDYSLTCRPFGIKLISDVSTGTITADDPIMFMGKWIEDVCDGIHQMALGRSELGENESFMKVHDNYLYAQSFSKGKGMVCRINLSDPESVESVLEGYDIHAFAISNSGRIVCTVGNLYDPPELYVTDGVGKDSLKRMTHSNDWLSEYCLGEVHSYWTKSRGEEVDLQYWVVTPPEYDPEKKYPAVFDAKGGPATCYGESFWHEFQALAAENIIVVYGNPRGSVGYGRKFNSDMICWNDGAMEDHLAILDSAIENTSIDTDHLGITGGSYGGYTTMKLIGRTDTFTAAVAQRALANPVTSYGTGDVGFVSSGVVPDDFKMKDFLTDRAEGNVISYVDKMKNPLLILHASHDFRCGYEQAEQIFVPMHERNPEIPIRLVRFKGENHGLTRIGKLHNQMRHLKELVCWFRKYLIDEPWTRVDTGARYGLACEGRVTVNGEPIGASDVLKQTGGQDD